MQHVETTFSLFSMIYKCNDLKLSVSRSTGVMREITEQNGLSGSWHPTGNLTMMAETRNGLHTGLYQSWSGGMRTEVSMRREGKRTGETIRFVSSDYTSYFCRREDTFDDITPTVKKFFKNCRRPTKEEQLDLVLVYNIDLIPADLTEIRNPISKCIYLDNS